MNLHKLFLTKNNCYKTANIVAPKGIMVHSTGANNPNLRRYIGPDDGILGRNTAGNHWNTATPGGKKVCVHAFIGKLKDGSVATYQTLPWNYQGWHAGGDANDTHIGFEICEDNLTNSDYFHQVYQEAVELCAFLCNEFNLPVSSIICHSEGYKLGLASNHADVMHWFPKHGKSMDTLRKDVSALLASSGTEPQKPVIPEVITPYRVRVKVPDLNIRKGPGTNHATQGRFTGVGVFTIVAEADGPGAEKWGLLKAYSSRKDGWISLDYATRI